MGHESPSVVTEVDGPIAIIRFNRPEQRNPLTTGTLDDLKQSTSTLFARDDIKTVIFTGSDDVFASGANIRELEQLDPQGALRFSQFGQNLFQTIADASQLTIAAINGFCMGGALDLALSCDIRVASSTAVFSHPGARLGIITGWGGTQRLSRVVGRGRALEFFATARRYSSAEALELGLICRVGDPVMACAVECAYGAIAVAATPSSGTGQYPFCSLQSGGRSR
jgi:enoyl-CoA hydratase